MSKKSEKRFMKKARTALDAIRVISSDVASNAVGQVDAAAREAFKVFEAQAHADAQAEVQRQKGTAGAAEALSKEAGVPLTAKQQYLKLRETNKQAATLFYVAHQNEIERDWDDPRSKRDH